ncbi:MAG: T9SS type A sorting domain-containing protein [Bacteroidota bacterium]
MRKSNLLFTAAAILLSACFALAQPYGVGHKVITFKDPARSNRSIETDIFYPATTTGEDKTFVNGQFPVIIFGHGFVMASADLYSYIWNSLIPNGYIVAFPRTEGSSLFPPPNHGKFAEDIAFLNLKLKSENNISSSFFYHHITNKSAAMGHSMGGKSATMAVANNTNFSAYISMGAAKEEGVNNNNVIGNYAPYVTIPSLVLSGEKDCCAPPAANQIPIYEAIPASCKTFISIIEGGHCNFGSKSGWCEIAQQGECGTLDRTSQNNLVLNYIKPFLDYVLKNDASAEALFVSRLNNGAVEYKRSCYGTTIQSDYLPFILADKYKGGALTNVNFTLHNADKYNTYLWDFGDLGVSTSKNPGHRYLFNGTYCVKVRLNNYWTGADTTIVIDTCIVINSSASRGGNKSLTSFDSENENLDNVLSIYPNPASDVLNLKFEEDLTIESNSLRIFDITGREMTFNSDKSEGSEFKIDISNFPNGMYLIKLNNTGLQKTFIVNK